jgi:hypothetical protein
MQLLAYKPVPALCYLKLKLSRYHGYTYTKQKARGSNTWLDRHGWPTNAQLPGIEMNASAETRRAIVFTN